MSSTAEINAEVRAHALGDRLRQIAAQADDQPLLGVALIRIADKEHYIAIPANAFTLSEDPERLMMEFGLCLYQAMLNNTKPRKCLETSGDTEEQS